MATRRKPAGPLPIDWARVIIDLESKGLTHRAIATGCARGDWPGAGKSWVNGLKNIPGTRPKFGEGALLLALWSDAMGLSPAEAPKVEMA